MFILTGLTFKVLVLDSNGTDRRSICKRKGSLFHICEVDHGRLNSLVVRSKTVIKIFSKIFRFDLWELFTATNNALVERFKRTKIQVCISIIFS